MVIWVEDTEAECMQNIYTLHLARKQINKYSNVLN